MPANWSRTPNALTVLSGDIDTVVTRPLDFFTGVKVGVFQGVSLDAAFGQNPDIDAAEDIWPGGGEYTGFPLTTLETVSALSSDANDAAAGTGARTIRVSGLDSNFNLISEVLTLNGLTPVASTQIFSRVYRVQVLTAGSGVANIGTITVRHTTTTANVFSVMQVGFNRSTDCVFTIPANTVGIIRRVSVAGSRSTGTIIGDFSLRAREPGGVFQVVRIYTAGNGMAVNIPYSGGFVMAPKTDIKFRCDSVSATNGDFITDFAYLLYRQL